MRRRKEGQNRRIVVEFCDSRECLDGEDLIANVRGGVR